MQLGNFKNPANDKWYYKDPTQPSGWHEIEGVDDILCMEYLPIY